MHILVVEDGQSQRELLRDFLASAGYVVSEARTGEEAFDQVRKGYVDLLLLDYRLPGMDGMKVLEETKHLNPEIDIVMMTAFGTVDTAVKAMKAGALDYITKPIELEELLILIRRVAERRSLAKENEILREELRGKGITEEQIIYRSQAMAEVIHLAGKVAKSQATILIHGESGSGKELIARLIHTFSPRSGKPMVTVNCAALPDNLLESELFGHEKGAFTGAFQRRIGRFEEADGGTLFLDEIGDLSGQVQVKLLRFLQEREFQRLGSNRTLSSDVRIISATNRDLHARVREGTFRQDLFYRLHVVDVSIPPLRERKEDIPPLIEHFMQRFARENGKEIMSMSSEARALLMKYDYPGNVRELENILERAVVISSGSILSVRDLPFPSEQKTVNGGFLSSGKTLRETVEAMERRMIREAMEQVDNHQTRAADLLGISERMLRYKLRKYELKTV